MHVYSKYTYAWVIVREYNGVLMCMLTLVPLPGTRYCMSTRYFVLRANYN